METLKEHFNWLALENSEFENRQKNQSNRTFLHFWIIKIPHQGTNSEIVQSDIHLQVKHGHSDIHGRTQISSFLER